MENKHRKTLWIAAVCIVLVIAGAAFFFETGDEVSGNVMFRELKLFLKILWDIRIRKHF